MLKLFVSMGSASFCHQLIAGFLKRHEKIDKPLLLSIDGDDFYPDGATLDATDSPTPHFSVSLVDSTTRVQTSFQSSTGFTSTSLKSDHSGRTVGSLLTSNGRGKTPLKGG
jgi:hypothetical protein